MKIASYDRIIRFDDEYGIYILFENKVYLPAKKEFQENLFGATTSNLKIVPTKFSNAGQSIVFTRGNWGTHIEVYGYTDDNPNIWWGNIQEKWHCVKSKPEGHYHYAC